MGLVVIAFLVYITILEINAVLNIALIGGIMSRLLMGTIILMAMEANGYVTMHRDARITALIACLDGQWQL